MKISNIGFLALALVLVAGCVHERWLVPAPNAALVPGARDVAEASVAGVRVTVAGNAWRGSPQDLEAIITPLQVNIENQSGKPIRVRYADFALVGGSGFRYAALSPLNLQESRAGNEPRAGLNPDAKAETVVPTVERAYYRAWRPRFAYRHFYFAPAWGFYYPWGYPWPYAWPYEPFYYPHHYGWPISLPTAEMIQSALPEGVVGNGGRVGGFLYFQGVSQREQQVTFEMQVTDASSGEPLGTLSVPLVVSWHGG